MPGRTVGRGLSPRRSLVARLVLSFLALSVLMVAVVAAVAYLRARATLETSVYERLQAVADERADSLDRWIDEQQRNVVFAGLIPGVGDDARTALDPALGPVAQAGAHDDVAARLASLIQQTADVQEFMVLDDAGVVRISTRPEHEGATLADQPFFQRGISNTTVQNVHTSPLTGQPAVTIGTPLFDADGKGARVGVLAGNLSLSRVDRIVLARSGLGASGEAYLVGGDHRFVHPTLETEAWASGVTSPGIDRALAGEDGQALYPDYKGVPVIGVYRWLDDREAALVVEMSQAEAFGPANDLAISIALVGLVAALLLAVAIYLVSRQVARPILSLAGVATRVKDGDLTAAAAIETEDEIGVLAAAFNDMTAQLRESVETLERRVEERTAELTAALEAQREAEQRYRRLVEELPLAVYMDRPDDPLGASLYVSPPIEAMFGYPAESWLEDGFFRSIVHPDDAEVITSAEGYMHQEADRATGEYRIVAADGRTVWIRDDNTLVRDERGKPAYVLGFFLDVTKQNDAAAEVRRQKSYFESLVAISPAAVVTMDRDERVTGWNPAAERLFGYSPEEAIGQGIDGLVMDTDAMREEGAGIAREAVETGRASRMSRRTRKDRQSVDVEITMVPLFVDGEHTGFYAVYHDITELQAARREADAANQAKSTFLAAMSHEIRTPMNAVIGMSGLLLDTELTTDQEEYSRIIRSSGESLLTIINDILDFSKIEAGRMELESAPFDLIGCVEGALDLMAARSAEKGIELIGDVRAGTPRIVTGDVTRIRQIVLNLVSNAIKFTESGEVAVTVAAEEDPGASAGQERIRVRISVRDTGLGIPADKIDRLFQSFSQADVSTSRRYGGTGLGLAISRRLAELMGGEMWVESAGVAGQGSTFNVRVPFRRPVGEPAAPPVLAPTALASRRVLVVDDNPAVRDTVSAMLASWGAEVAAAPSLEVARVVVGGDGTLALAIVDELLPEPGLDLVEALAGRRGGAVPTIVMSSFGRREAIARDAEQRGIVLAAHVSKPVKPGSLAIAVSIALGLATPAGEAAKRGTGPDPEMATRHPLRILLAEDNAVNQRLAVRLLEQRGYAIDVASNGLEAIEAIERSAYDLVLMDVQMPEMDGLEATRRIVERWTAPNRPRIVAMTANATQEDREACIMSGMDGYIAKPIRVPELIAEIEATQARAVLGPAGA